MFRRRRRSSSPPDPRWRAMLDEHVALWRDLDAGGRSLLLERIAAWIPARRWEGIGFDVDEVAQVVVAANAALLGLGFERDPFDDVSSVVLYPTTVVRRGVRRLGGGVAASGPFALHGETVRGGPVVLVWRAVAAGSQHPERGRNVVVHEFAHRLDLRDGVVDGMPPLPDRRRELVWQQVRDDVMAALVEEVDPFLGRYASTNDGELFAVASERFFTRPHDLRMRFPRLYGELAAFYRQDPGERRPDDAARGTSGL